MSHSAKSSHKLSINRCFTRHGLAMAAAVIAMFLGLAGNGFASDIANPGNPFKRTLVVSPVPGDPGASGSRLLASVRSISPRPSDPWLVKIEPGVFDIGNESLALVPGLELQGSGQDITVVQGLGQALDAGFNRGKGVINGSDFATLRDLTVRCVTDSEAGLGGCISIANVNASPALHRVAVEVQGFGNHWGIRNHNSSPRIEELTLWLDGGTDNYGIVNAHASFPEILRTSITAGNGSNLNVGIFDRDGGGPTIIEDSQIVALGGQEAVGIYEYTLSPVNVTIDDAYVQAADANVNTGILTNAHSFEIQGAVITGDVAIDSLGEVSVTSSELMAGDSTVVQADVVRLGSTRLTSSGAILGFSQSICAGVYVLSEPVQFFATDCPGGVSSRERGPQGLRSARAVPGGELG